MRHPGEQIGSCLLPVAAPRREQPVKQWREFLRLAAAFAEAGQKAERARQRQEIG